jgi:magnesium chelatase accessory protein
VPPSTSTTVAHRLAARGTRVEHHGLPGLGHLAHEEAPERHAQLVEQFARGVGVLD